MFPIVNTWTPGFSRITGLGQVTPLVPPASAAPSVQSGPRIAAGVGVGLLTLGIAGLSTAFMYGVARDSKSNIVKYPGYILAGLGAVVGLIEAVGVGTIIIAGR